MENILKKYPCVILLVITYFFFLPKLLSFDCAWMLPEQFFVESDILTNGNKLCPRDLDHSLDWKTLEWAPRVTPPLSSFFTTLDIKFRSWAWNYILPHPSLSLTWIFSLFLIASLFISLIKEHQGRSPCSPRPYLFLSFNPRSPWNDRPVCPSGKSDD